MTVAAIIVAAGKGARAGGSVPKQFALLCGKPMLMHSVTALSLHPAITDITLVVGEGQEDDAREKLGGCMNFVKLVTGGAERRDSVRAGLEALDAKGVTRVLIHDAARPFLSAAVIDALLAALDHAPGAVPALPVADTLARGDVLLGDNVPRAGLNRIQTPQAFHFDAILAAHRAWPGGEEATDDAQMLRRMGQDVMLVPGDPMLEKITHPADFAAAEARHAATMISRSATGFDVHRFEAGQELWLGGVLIPHDRGLSGHSDADVALHAITDALLGTIGAGDIGMHFPPSDPKWRGAASAQFLEHAAGLVRDQGGIVDFVDVTIICEAPKIGPHRETIRASIAAILALPVSRVSLKATTTERLGFTGRGEGMAAQAIATVRLPE
ncbi:bifunctional 2-C-methyl-D-erythritol 4-phosphate cytidylyltransferase/2-C-methyl-D-erythritol 2,4-cyclodiphosphate synthase [Sphingomonas koreensis]|jgi:2-C-methyl-D-erythritol 4-phosphate cytidylyltransferase/2-C-methyl-D-erythritol 2,4-cyclodiphosphate synthase|uniref:Bifunctional enzyme IspD/IspF n=1 Tax=Sphingomonas koreensis TaxID=93064 RepID=A0A1L6JBW0_9SPHN|nr:bifunctional 2-C-methyl-D-erythritol 4-phosphate cytidylyltransferase/2-C-methyl-D-erythritol 2,4-cyclodiphosphate synthase [Sphingomonas koreensis]APR53414.1 bifunctional 2-C-methyl-D-erythritol 4-phosphate cytidylyltransferase/2-C-methyl-D-erythritol 2,4-cyclodiphosphate synthase [Sphingomonas koreensis]MDC7809898.1 bifunctional 2-C-methyl-D-erythritol 4-phosphate cytidylyltransferase/2-C-methyl-D-erythritol 2,4-cyclodiphosphate synthase [Sphingomonas koreensis]RSU24461.1 bifunctional 2-C-m